MNLQFDQLDELLSRIMHYDDALAEETRNLVEAINQSAYLKGRLEEANQWRK